MNPQTYKEVLRAPLWLGAFIFFMLGSLVVAIWAAFDNRSALISALVALVVGIVGISSLTREISYDGRELRVGRAHIEREFIAEIEVLNRDEFVLARTRDVDPAAFFALTFWVSQGVKLTINDERDPTPYWLISTRRGEVLAKSLRS